MKARIKKTGEVLNIAPYATIHVDKCDDWGNPVEYPVSEVEIIPEIEPIVFHGPAFEPDWEQRRYEIARDCFPKAIEMAQSQTIYSCTSHGRIKISSQRKILKGGEIMSNERVLTPQITYQGYLTVSIKGYPRFVHRLVALAFVPNPKNLPCVNHKDENKGNPIPDNLEWCDVRYNTLYGSAMERRARTRGSSVLQYTIDGDFVAEYYSMGVAAKSIGAKSAGNICMCCKGERPVAYGYVWKYKEK